jgi:hypothetical protein
MYLSASLPAPPPGQLASQPSVYQSVCLSITWRFRAWIGRLHAAHNTAVHNRHRLNVVDAEAAALEMVPNTHAQCLAIDQGWGFRTSGATSTC